MLGLTSAFALIGYITMAVLLGPLVDDFGVSTSEWSVCINEAITLGVQSELAIMNIVNSQNPYVEEACEYPHANSMSLTFSLFLALPAVGALSGGLVFFFSKQYKKVWGVVFRRVLRATSRTAVSSVAPKNSHQISNAAVCDSDDDRYGTVKNAKVLKNDGDDDDDRYATRK